MEYEKLAFVARAVLHESSPRVMAVLDPVQVTIASFSSLLEGHQEGEKEGKASASASLSLRLAKAKEGSDAKCPQVECSVPDFPHDPSRGSHTVRCSDKVPYPLLC